MKTLKLHLLFVLGAIGFASGSDHTITIHTVNKYSYFPMRSNRVEFSVKAPHNAFFILTNGPRDDQQRYEIVFGGYGNTKTSLWKNGERDPRVSVPGGYLDGGSFREFWVEVNREDLSITAGVGGSPEPLIYFKDPHLMGSITTFGISTGWKAVGYWKLRMDAFGCSCNDIESI